MRAVKKWTPRRKIAVVSASVLVSCAITAAIGMLVISEAARGISGWNNGAKGCLGEKPYPQQVVEQMARLKLPDVISDLHIETEGLQDCVIYLDFKIPPTQLRNFLSTTRIKGSLTPTNDVKRFAPLPLPLNWQLDAKRTYLGGEHYNGNLEWQKVLVDTNDPGMYKVYFLTVLG